MRRHAFALALPVVLAASCSSSGHSATVHTAVPQSSASRTQATKLTSDPALNWSTYHHTNGRSGVSSGAVTGALHGDWTTKLDGAVYGESIYVNGLLIAATENDSVYGLNPKTGKVEWRRHLGTPQDQGQLQCGNINPLGITGTPAYDASTGSVFVVAETEGMHHTLWALNAANGHRRWHVNTDIAKGRDPGTEQQRSALLVSHGRILTSYGGLAGDCGNYVGYTTSTSVTGKGKTTHYEVPTAREAGMWSPAGPVEGADGNIYVASGNGAEEHGKWDKSDSVTELDPTSMHRIAVFAPATWKDDNIRDLDLGSSSPVPVNGRIVIAGKRGVVYLLKPSLGGVGSAIKALSGCTAFGGAAHLGSTVIMPCTDGVRALAVGKHSLRWKWSASGVYGSPVIAGKRVYVADADSGQVKVLSLATGHVISSVGAGSFTHFPSVTIVGNHIFVPTLAGITAIRGS